VAKKTSQVNSLATIELENQRLKEQLKKVQSVLERTEQQLEQARASKLRLNIGNGRQPRSDRDTFVRVIIPDSHGCYIDDQLIVWRQNPATFRFEVASWTLCDTQSKYPVRMPSGVYRVTWTDSGKPREVVSRQYRESWTQTDPEREDQKRVHPDDRIRLMQTP